MDPNSTFTLNIKLFGNKKKVRKDMICWTFDMVIDSDLTNYMDLVEEIVNKYPPGYLEVAHVQYYDDVMKTFPEVVCDQELMSMFEKHSKTKVVDMFISYCDPSEPFQPFQEWPSGVSKSNDHEEEHSYLSNPLPKNEHAVFDEEIMYLEKEPIEVLTGDKDNDKDKDEGDDLSEDEGEDGSEVEIESGLEPDQEVVEQVSNLEYDKEDPPMEVGCTYPNMPEFKLALQTHAIKHEFEYNTEKSAPYRFRAYCSRKDKDNCQWRLHASVKDDLCTVVVISFSDFFAFCFADFF
jgi:hypothetical protein